MRLRETLKNIPPYELSGEIRRTKLRLDANENLWGPAPEVMNALKALVPEDIAAYPDVRALTAASARQFGVKPDNILLSNGADEAIYALMAALAGPGDRIVMPVPAFSVYTIAANLQGGRIQGVPLGPDFAFIRSAVLRAIDRTTRLVVLITPNNPTGTIIEKEDLEAVLQKTSRRDIPVILDETYSGFLNRTHVCLTWRFPNLIVVGSFSKYFALAGLRLGYTIARPEVIVALRKILQPYSVNAAALAAGQAALGTPDYYNGVRRGIVRERTKLAKAFKKIGLKAYSAGGNFFCVRIGPDADRVRGRLAASGILVKGFRGEPALSSCLRISIGRPAENERLLAALKSALPPEALLFDLDGVLVDVSASYRRAIIQTASRFLGKPVSPAEVDRLKLQPGMNNDWDATAALLRSHNVLIPRPELISVFQGFYRGNGVRSGLMASERWILPKRRLRDLAARYRLGIVTGRPMEEARLALQRSGTNEYFQTIIALEDTGRRQKPDPCGLRLALRRLGVGRAAYFGDSPDDMAAARSAGVTAVAVRPPGLRSSAAWGRRMKEAGASRLDPDLLTALEEYR
jgi:histidinol-phosphate aminotransferase